MRFANKKKEVKHAINDNLLLPVRSEIVIFTEVFFLTNTPQFLSDISYDVRTGVEKRFILFQAAKKSSGKFTILFIRLSR